MPLVIRPPSVFIQEDSLGHEFYCCMDRYDLPGFYYFPNYVSEEEERDIINIVDSSPWATAISRRQQHYGYTYYHTRHDLVEIQPLHQPNINEEKEEVSSSAHTAGELSTFSWLLERQYKDELFPEENPPTQCLVNEYVGNKGIRGHVDNPICFGDVITGLTLEDPVWMVLRREDNPDVYTKVYLAPRSLYVLSGEARFLWRHGITRGKRVWDPINEKWIFRDETYRRLSLTFRDIKVEGTKKVEKDMYTERSC